MNSAYFSICLRYLCFLILMNALLCVVYVSNIQAGIIGEIGDIGVKIALINIWKGLGGLAMFGAGSYLIANKRPFRYKAMAVATSIMLFCMTITGVLLLIGEFWPAISKVVKIIAAFIKHLFS